jgi:hypothetical protein
MKVNSLLFAQDSTLMIGGSDDRSVRSRLWLRDASGIDCCVLAGENMGSQIA